MNVNNPAAVTRALAGWMKMAHEIFESDGELSDNRRRAHYSWCAKASQLRGAPVPLVADVRFAERAAWSIRSGAPRH